MKTSYNKQITETIPFTQQPEMSKSYYLNEIRKIIETPSNPIHHYLSSKLSIKNWIKEWDFKKSKIDIYTHQIHKYPAMFIPQLIRKLLYEYSDEGDVVMDIFSGSGTTSVECLLTNRNSVGIELNPLANCISKVKTTPLKQDKLVKSYKSLIKNYFDSKVDTPNSFAGIDTWFLESSIKYLSHLLKCIRLEKNGDVHRVFEVSFSDIIRYVSLVRHNGFKLHRDKTKFDVEWTKETLFQEFHKSFCKSFRGLTDLYKDKTDVSTTLLKNNSAKFLKEYSDSIDLIITSPPYGDSRTTVAYGQFSRLSSQWLGYIGSNEKGHIRNIDNELLGGKTNGIELNDPVLERSITLYSSILGFKSLIDSSEGEEKKKLVKRTKDVLSFYIDLEKTIINGSKYLKSDKYFILITGSRIVKGIKLNTDLIIAELGENYGLLLDGILYRKTIPNKRMPHKVSATNVVGEKTPTMSKESIVILRKK